jgi:hypothetical protein
MSQRGGVATARPGVGIRRPGHKSLCAVGWSMDEGFLCAVGWSMDENVARAGAVASSSVVIATWRSMNRSAPERPVVSTSNSEIAV